MFKPLKNHSDSRQRNSQGLGSVSGAHSGHKSRPPFRDFYRSIWSPRNISASFRYKVHAGILVCRDGRVFKEKYHILYWNLMIILPFLAVFLSWFSGLFLNFFPGPDFDSAETVEDFRQLYQTDQKNQSLSRLILLLMFLFLYFVVYPLIRYFCNRFDLIDENDAAHRMDMHNEFLDL